MLAFKTSQALYPGPKRKKKSTSRNVRKKTIQDPHGSIFGTSKGKPLTSAAPIPIATLAVYSLCLDPTWWNCLRRIRRRGLVGGSVSLGVGFKVTKASLSPSLFSPLSPPPLPHLCVSGDWDVTSSATVLAPCLSASRHDNHGLNS